MHHKTPGNYRVFEPLYAQHLQCLTECTKITHRRSLALAYIAFTKSLEFTSFRALAYTKFLDFTRQRPLSYPGAERTKKSQAPIKLVQSFPAPEFPKHLLRLFLEITSRGNNNLKKRPHEVIFLACFNGGFRRVSKITSEKFRQKIASKES